MSNTGGMNPIRYLQRNDGISRTRRLIERGLSTHSIRALVARAQLVRPAHGWIALPGVAPQLVHAVQHGAVLSCMSVVELRGLWMPTPLARPHVAARTPKSQVIPGDHVCHWAMPKLRREPFQVVDHLENALVFAAACLPTEHALAVWESALRRGATTRARLALLALNRRERELLDACSEFSDSGLESYVGHRLRSLQLHVVPQAWVLGHRVDFLIERALVLQIDGGHHVGPQRDADNLQDAELAVNGYVTIRVSSRQVERDWPEVQRLIMTALSQLRARPQLPG